MISIAQQSHKKRHKAREIANEESINIRWGEESLRELSKRNQVAYERIVFCKKNLFMLPTGAAAKKYITETTKVVNDWTNNLLLKDITYKAMHIMPCLLLQKPSKTSKAKGHLKALVRRTDLWSKGKIDELLSEGETIQTRLHHISRTKSIGANCLRSLLYWCKKEMWMVRWNYWQATFPTVYFLWMIRP